MGSADSRRLPMTLSHYTLPLPLYPIGRAFCRLSQFSYCLLPLALTVGPTAAIASRHAACRGFPTQSQTGATMAAILYPCNAPVSSQMSPPTPLPMAQLATQGRSSFLLFSFWLCFHLLTSSLY